MTKKKPTHRIPYDNWINSQLSIARHYGGINLHGRHYMLDPDCVYGDDGKGKPDLITYEKLSPAETVMQMIKERP